MSRFATPNRSRPLVVANSPSIPVQKEPGHRYANGIQLPGPSFKGRHVIEININGMRMHSPTRERPTSAERTNSPGGTIRELQATHKVASLADSCSLPKPTTKPFVVPDRARRSSRPRTLSSSALSDIDLTAGKSINRGRNETPTRRLSRDFSINSEVVSVTGLPRSSSAQSVRSSSNRSVSSAVSSISGTAFGSSVRSFSAGRTARSHSPIQYLTGGQHSSLSNSNAHIHQSLANTKRTDQAHQRNANKLELSQAAYRHFRKAVVRDAIHNFLQDEEVHREHLDIMAIGDDDVDESLQDLLDLSIAGPPALNNEMRPRSQNADSGEESNDDVGEGFLDANGTVMTSKMAMGKEDRRKFRRLHKMIKLLRQSIVDDLNMQGLTLPVSPKLGASEVPPTVTPENLFFPSQHMHSVIVAKNRSELLDLIVQWRQLYTNNALAALDRYYASWVTARSQRLQSQRQYLEAVAQHKAQDQQKQALRQEIVRYRQRAQQLGLTLPPNWFPAELGLDEFHDGTTQSISGSTALARNISPSATMGTGSLRDLSNNSVSNYSSTRPMMSPNGGQSVAYDASQSVFLSPKSFIQSNIRSLSQSQQLQQQQQHLAFPLSPQQLQSKISVRQPSISPNPAASTSSLGTVGGTSNNFSSSNIQLMTTPNTNRGRFSYGAGTNTNLQGVMMPSPAVTGTTSPPPPPPPATDNNKLTINYDILRVLNASKGNTPTPNSTSAAAAAFVASSLSPQHQYNQYKPT